jgi:pentatricopeptide repeat protein
VVEPDAVMFVGVLIVCAPIIISPCLKKGCRFTNRSGNEALELFHQMQQDGVDQALYGC